MKKKKYDYRVENFLGHISCTTRVNEVTRLGTSQLECGRNYTPFHVCVSSGRGFKYTAYQNSLPGLPETVSSERQSRLSKIW